MYTNLLYTDIAGKAEWDKWDEWDRLYSELRVTTGLQQEDEEE